MINYAAVKLIPITLSRINRIIAQDLLLPQCFNCHNRLSSSHTKSNEQTLKTPENYVDTTSVNCARMIKTGDIKLIPNFITELEENSILKEIGPYMSRLRYEYSHWDDAIHGYKETERSVWNSENQVIIDRLKAHAFEGNPSPPTDFVHVLDLEATGEIKPHKDSVRYCGDTVSGISLLSDSVMRLARCDDALDYIDLLLERRSLYILRNEARYKYTHEIRHNDQSTFKSKPLVKTRRISIICRNCPTTEQMEE